jgi:hypothetical protein
MPVVFRLKGVNRWKKALNAQGFDRAARRNMRRATALNGKIAEATMRKTIQSSRLIKRNAALTKAIKGSAKPLVDDAAMFKAINSRVIDDYTAFAGVLRTDRSFNVAVMTHEGKEKILVTRKMRAMFRALWQASEGRISADKLTGRAKELFEERPFGWYPLKFSTKFIVLPKRPWVDITFRNTKMASLVRKNWEDALVATFRDRAKGK